MLATGEKKLLSRHNRAQRVGAAKQLLVPSVTPDSTSLNVKVNYICQYVTLLSMFRVIPCVADITCLFNVVSPPAAGRMIVCLVTVLVPFIYIEYMTR